MSDADEESDVSYRPQLRQEWIVTFLEISVVISTVLRTQETHMLEGFCWITIPQTQHNIEGSVPW